MSCAISDAPFLPLSLRTDMLSQKSRWVDRAAADAAQVMTWLSSNIFEFCHSGPWTLCSCSIQWPRTKSDQAERNSPKGKGRGFPLIALFAICVAVAWFIPFSSSSSLSFAGPYPAYVLFLNSFSSFLLWLTSCLSFSFPILSVLFASNYVSFLDRSVHISLKLKRTRN